MKNVRLEKPKYAEEGYEIKGLSDFVKVEAF